MAGMNTMDVVQSKTILDAVVSQATGSPIAQLASKDFVTVAKVGLEVGYDKLGTALSQVLSKTIWTQRPYTRKLKVLETDPIRYGNHVRKMNILDSGWEDDERLSLVDGQSIDQYKVKKPQIVQTNFYGEITYARHITIYRDQLDTALSGPEEFARFISMVMSNAADQIEQAHEESARLTLNNLIGGLYLGGNTESKIHLVTEYKAWAGITDANWVFSSPENFPNFARWAFGRIKTASQAMENRTYMFHTNPVSAQPVGGNIARHTPVTDQKLVIYTPLFNTIDATVLSDTFNDDYLKLMDYEGVSFWQSPAEPDKISVNASYMLADGTLTNGAVALGGTNAGVLGVIFDRETAGYNPVNTWTAPTPFNAAGGYTNIHYHFTDRYYNDFTENGVLLLLD